VTRINRFECTTHRKAILIAFGLLVIMLMLLIFSRQLSGTTLEKLSEAAAPQIMDTYGRLPLMFEVNRGQTDSQVKYLSRGRGYGLFLTPGEVVLVARKSHIKQSASSNRLASRYKKTAHAESTTPTIVRMRLVGPNRAPGVIGVEQLPGRNHYFIGNNPNKWIRNIPQYARVKYGGIYPGVDLIFYGNQKQLEYDFVVNPGADPGVIRIKFAGMDKLSLDDNGNLVLQIGNDRIIMRAPVIYQEINNEKQRVAGHYLLCKTGEVGFNVAPYDIGKPVVIDPVLVYSTYLGGSSSESGNGITLDADGNAYVTGSTSSSNFPMAASTPFQDYNKGGSDAFVTKLNSEGTALVYSTYLGGSGNDEGLGIAVDISGNAYVTGSTYSNDFPKAGTPAPFQGTLSGGSGSDAFVTKLNSEGTALVYSTYLGGGSNDYGQGIAVDSPGNAYVTGYTDSSNFPMVAGDTPFQDSNKGGSDVFVTKINSEGTELDYSTYLGGSSNDYGKGIAVDSSGYAYVTGYTFYTYSSHFPTAGTPFQDSNEGGSDAFVTKLNSEGSALLYSTFLGGSGDDEGLGIAVDSDNNVYVTGSTLSTDFPTENSVQSTKSVSYDAFIARFDSTGSTLLYSSYLGGNSEDYGKGISVDSSGNAYVTGSTDSTDFPTKNPVQANKGVGSDAFITKSSTKDITPAPSPPDGGGGGCFIATASYGSSMSDEVMVLREFRDRYLLTNSTGRKFVKCYYRYSPPVARYIERNDTFRTAARISLLPVVYSIRYPFIAFGIFLTCMLVTIRKQKKDKY